jgi:hypothetical protein
VSSEWDGTPWGGTPASPSALVTVPHDGMATAVKAATGWQAYFSGDKPILYGRTPQAMMREAQGLYHTNPWIGLAERTVTRKVVGLPWHIEDDNDDTVDDEANPALQAITALFEKPQDALPPELRQPGIKTRKGLFSIITRHAGLCGISYVYPDTPDANGIPLALIYVNPARVFPKTTEQGTLIGYAVDADDNGNGGTPFQPEDLIPFYLEVPDWSATTHGLVMAAALKARIVSASDVHALSVLGTGGRIAGLVAPKDGYIADDEQFADLERSFRVINEDPAAAKRTTLLRGPIDYFQTAADPQQLALDKLASTARDDILAIWGVPPSQAGVPQPRGLNGGSATQDEVAILMTGAVHDRVEMIRETFQFDLLDRWQKVGLNPQLVIEEPTFEDDAAPYVLAAQAVAQPLTWNERRAILSLDPLPDYGPDGEPLGLAIVLPSLYTIIAQGPEPGNPTNPFGNAPQPKPEPIPPPSPFGTTAVSLPQIPATVPAKAGGFLGLRKAIDQRVVPAMRKTLDAFLASQRSEIVERIRHATPRQLKDPTYWFSAEKWDRALGKAIRPHVSGVVVTVTDRTTQLLKHEGKAEIDPYVAEVERYVLERTGKRITGINEHTRDSIAGIIRQSLELETPMTSSDIADAVQASTLFDDARSEVIARTESAFAYNAASISSFQQYGVEQVEAIDGDQDEVCADRNGRTFGVDEAFDIEDHPNGTLDWVPILPKADIGAAFVDMGKAMLALAEREQPTPVVNVTMPELSIQPEISVAPPNLVIERGAVEVHMPEPRPVTRQIIRDGKVTAEMREEPA